MFLKVPSKLRDSLARKSSLKTDDAIEQEELDDNAVEAEDTLVSQITDLEEMVNKRTRELDEARQQLSQLSSTEDSSSDEDEKQVVRPASTIETSDKDETQVEELFTRPNLPADELSVQPEAESTGEVKAPEVAVAQAGEEDTKESSGEGESNALSDIFSGEEEEENLLSGLINSLPDVDAVELLAEAKEINEMIRQWKHK